MLFLTRSSTNPQSYPQELGNSASILSHLLDIVGHRQCTLRILRRIPVSSRAKKRYNRTMTDEPNTNDKTIANDETSDTSPPLPAPLAEGIEVIRAYLKTLPASPGVYRMIDGKGDVLYVGKAKRLAQRVPAYTQPARLPFRLQRMVSQTRRMEFVTTQTEGEALLLECSLIKNLRPRYNILLRDDKAFPYLALTHHDFPRLIKHRGTRNEKDATYYGPFASASAVNETLHALQKAFRIRTCTDAMLASRTRPCLQFHIKRCTAPCVERVSLADYAKQIQQAKDFLSGKSSTIQRELAQQMQEAAAARDYESAATFRDRIRSLTAIQQRQDVQFEGIIDDADVVAIAAQSGQTCVQVFFFRQGRNYGTCSYFPAHEPNAPLGDILAAFIGQFYVSRPAPPLILVNETPAEANLIAEALGTTLQNPQRGNKHRLVAHVANNAQQAIQRHLATRTTQSRLLEEVAALFNLDAPPQRIEVYDNSHIQGHAAVGAMIVAGEEGFIKNQYRKFNIKDKDAAGDDFAMMREVMRRRFAREKTEDGEKLPDLVLIDGGAGQLSAVTETLQELGRDDIPLVAIAKGPDRNAGREWFFMEGKEPFQLPPNDPVLFYLQRLRDESHRFVIGTHRAKRSKDFTANPLDALAGIGAARRKALLHHFGSARAVKEASLEELEKVKGISKALAAKIHAHFRE